MAADKKFLTIRTDLLLDRLEESGQPAASKAKLISEKLERSDKKEIEKMIDRRVSAEVKKIEQQRKKDIAALMKGKQFKKEITAVVSSEIKKSTADGSSLTQDEVVTVVKKVLVKLYRELAYNYSPVIDRIKI